MIHTILGDEGFAGNSLAHVERQHRAQLLGLVHVAMDFVKTIRRNSKKMTVL